MTTTLQDLKPSQIKPHKNNPRHDVGDVDELAASIREKGILEPLLVAPNGTAATFILLAGHRRLAAAKAAKCKTVPCVVREDLTDPAEQLEAMLVENLQRTDLSPVEEAEAYQQLLEFPGYTQKRITEATGRAAATVRARLKLAKLPKSALQKIHEHQISLMEAEGLAEFADDTAAYGRLERVAGDPQHFARVHRELRDARTRLRKVDKLHRELETGGVRVIASPSYYDYAAQSKLVSLHGEEAVEQHRGCEGFCAYLRTDSWSTSVEVVYVCDRPDLHADPAGEDGDDDEPAALRERHQREQELTEAAATRRAFLAATLQAPKSDGWALDLLRQHAHGAIRHSSWIGEILGVDAADKKATARRVDELTWQQLAVLLDVNDHSPGERNLSTVGYYGASDGGWSDTGVDYSGGRDWRRRLEKLYGYEWSELEQRFIAQAADHAATAAEYDEDDLVDDGDDVEDAPEDES